MVSTDEAILGVYLSGTNTPGLRGALAPLLRGAPLSKDAVSRLVGRLREDFAVWATRELGALTVRYLFLDGWYPRVRIGKKRVRVRVVVTLGVCADGQCVILDLRLAGAESERAWLDAVQSLVGRKLGAPVLAVIDGNPVWPLRSLRNGPGSRFSAAPTLEPAGQGSRQSARGTGRRLLAHDLRGEPRGGRAGSAWVCA